MGRHPLMSGLGLRYRSLRYDAGDVLDRGNPGADLEKIVPRPGALLFNFEQFQFDQQVPELSIVSHGGFFEVAVPSALRQRLGRIADGRASRPKRCLVAVPEHRIAAENRRSVQILDVLKDEQVEGWPGPGASAEVANSASW